MSIRDRVRARLMASLVLLVVIFALLLLTSAALAQMNDPPGPAVSSSAQGASNQAVPAMPGERASDKTAQYIHVPGSAFMPASSGAKTEFAPSGCTYNPGPGETSRYTPKLPNGATIIWMRLYYYDASQAHDGTMQLTRYDKAKDALVSTTLATAGSPGFSTLTVSKLNVPLDYARYSYSLNWNVGPAAGDSVQLCGLRIGFTPNPSLSANDVHP